jgi:hypothetical protein
VQGRGRPESREGAESGGEEKEGEEQGCSETSVAGIGVRQKSEGGGKGTRKALVLDKDEEDETPAEKKVKWDPVSR